jgi:gas vesicle protein
MPSKSFKDYLDDNDYKPTMKSKSKSIEYLEDLEVNDFIDAIRNLHKSIVAEKLDGTALTFGLDDANEFYTTRSGKGSSDKLFYKAADWGISAASNGFKATHAALKKHIEVIRSVMEPGEAMDVEIMFGRQPNTIVYGLDGYNYIAFLKSTPGTNKELKVDQKKVKKLYAKLKDATSDVRTINVDTNDGENLISAPTVTNWKFTTPEFINTKHFEDTDVKAEIAKLEKFLNKKNEAMSDLLHKDVTNFETARMSLTDVKTSIRSQAKGIKEDINDKIMNAYKLPIKQQLLDKFIRTVKPRLQDRDVEPSEDLGMEGIVVLDPKTQKQFKIVDKDTFSTLNKFNYEVRNNIRGVVRSEDEDAPLNLRGGLLGTAKIRIAALFQMPGLGKGYTTKRVIAKFKGDDPESTVANIVSSLGDVDYRAYKEKITAIIAHTSKELQETLDNFKENFHEYKVKLENGKEVGYTQEVVRRTLLVFAETRQSLKRMQAKIDDAQSMEDIIVGMFGKPIKQLFGDTPEAGEDSITEDEGGDGTPIAPSTGTCAGAIAPVPMLLFPGKMIKRITKTSTKIRKKKKANK